MWLKPVTDRTELDVVNQTEKGFRSQDDLNRIEINCQHLAKHLKESIRPVKMWGIEDIPTESETRRIQGTINVLYHNHKKKPYDIEPPSMLNITFETLNTIEKMLLEIKEENGVPD